MNLSVAHPWEQETRASFAAPAEPSSPRDDVLFAWTVVGTSGWTAIDDERFDRFLLLGPGTTSGWLREPGPPPSQSVLAELRSRTQLTWAQLARALGVQRRSLHFWARGERPSAANLERLMGIVGIVRAIDRGDPSETTAVLLDSRGDRPSAFALLCEGRDNEVLELLRPHLHHLSTGVRERTRRPPQLGREERARRRGGLSPLDRLDALHEADVPPLGQVIATIAIPPRKG
jgi:transcriptional regulator with XRE-family HTH domain